MKCAILMKYIAISVVGSAHTVCAIISALFAAAGNINTSVINPAVIADIEASLLLAAYSFLLFEFITNCSRTLEINPLRIVFV